MEFDELIKRLNAVADAGLFFTGKMSLILNVIMKSKRFHLNF